MNDPINPSRVIFFILFFQTTTRKGVRNGGVEGWIAL